MFKYVCGGASAIYGSAIPHELHASEVVDDLTFLPEQYGVSCVGAAFGPASYRWPISDDVALGLPPEAREALIGQFEINAHQTAPAVQIMHIADATVLQNIVYCSNAGEQRILYESFQGCDWSSLTRSNIPILDSVHGPDLSDDDHLDVYLGSTGYFNYGHWLVDDLPKLKGVEMLVASVHKRCRIILPAHNERMDAVRVESIRLLLGNAVQIRFVAPDLPWQFQRLHYISPVSYHPVRKSPPALDYVVHRTLAAATRDVPAAKLGKTERLLVLRGGGTAIRRLLNETAVRKRLEALDFRIMDTSTMSFAEQVLTISRASVVVGQMGAAMTNTLFCRPTTAVIHLAPRIWAEPFYLDLAANRGHRYYTLFGETSGSNEAHLSDFTIDVDQLEALIRAL